MTSSTDTISTYVIGLWISSVSTQLSMTYLSDPEAFEYSETMTAKTEQAITITAGQADTAVAVISIAWPNMSASPMWDYVGATSTGSYFAVLINPTSTLNEGSQPSLSPTMTSGAHNSLSSKPNPQDTSNSDTADASQGQQFPTPTPTSRPTDSPVDSNLSTGAVAGVAIGCLIGGALLAAFLGWLFLRRRKSSGRHVSEYKGLAPVSHEKEPGTKTTTLKSGSPVTASLESGLPQPLEDQALSGEITKISNLIKNHVQSYYRIGRVNSLVIDYKHVQALGKELPVSVGTLSTLLSDSTTRESALRFCIAWVVVARMQFQSPAEATFLPPEISRCLREMTIVNSGSGRKFCHFISWRVGTDYVQSTLYFFEDGALSRPSFFSRSMFKTRFLRTMLDSITSRQQSIYSTKYSAHTVIRSLMRRNGFAT
jgi:hypothetical protein